VLWSLRKHGIKDIIQTEIPKPIKRIDVVAEVNQVVEKGVTETKEKDKAHDVLTVTA